MTACRLVAEIMIESEHAMHFGARQIERCGDHRNGGPRHVAERLLKRVQDDERGAFQAVVLGDDLGAARLIPGVRRPMSFAFSIRGYMVLPMRIGISQNINKAVPWCDCKVRLIAIEHGSI